MVQYLRSSDVNVENGRETPRSKALERLLFRKAPIPVNRLLNLKKGLPTKGPYHINIPSLIHSILIALQIQLA